MSERSELQRVILIRHGETAWSLDRRHTGRTDIPLTERGRQRAAALAPMLAAIPGVATARVLTSPLRRARETAALAGFADRVETNDDLREWDYGDFEGLRTADIRDVIPGWSVWTHEITGGERLADVGRRADRVIACLGDGVTLLFAHAHVLRILAARWCGLEPSVGQILTIDPGSVSLLGHEREARVIERWNLVAGSPTELH